MIWNNWRKLSSGPGAQQLLQLRSCLIGQTCRGSAGGETLSPEGLRRFISAAQQATELPGWFPLFHLPSPRGQKVEWAQVGAAHTVGCEQQAVQRPGDAALPWERPSNLSPFLLGRDNSLEYLRGGEGEVSSFITLEWLWREISLHQGEEITIFINESALYPGGIHCL